MATATKYAYSVSGDFPNEKVAPPRLAQEIRNSVIAIALDYITVDGDDCDIWFKDVLSSEDQTALDSIVAVHSGEPLNDGQELRRADGRIVVDPVNWSEQDRLYMTGRGDDVDAGTRGTGALFDMETTEVGDETSISQFIDDVVLKGGTAFSSGGKMGDHVDFEIIAPATEVVSAAPNGNCNLVPIGPGINMIVPAAGDGDYDVTLSEAVPITAKDSEGQPNGYWNRDANGNPVPDSGQGGYNLFDFPIVLTRHVCGVPLISDGTLVLGDAQAKPATVLRQWKMRCTMHHTSDSTSIKLRWFLLCGRRLTTNPTDT